MLFSHQFMWFVVQLSIRVPVQAMPAPLWRERLVLNCVHLRVHLYPIERNWCGLPIPGPCKLDCATGVIGG